ncbi:MAG: hypothetical protein V4726_09325 [Verrucomicrobiota bacterium]
MRADAEVAAFGVADADAVGGGFFFADDEHAGDFLELGVADFGAGFPGAVVQPVRASFPRKLPAAPCHFLRPHSF